MILKVKYLRKIKILIYFIKNIFKIHNDHYVSYRWRDYSILGILKLENLKFIRRARIHYWQNKASKYRPFTPFFNANELRSIQQNSLIKSEVRDIYKTGSTIIENVLSQSDIDLINIFADSLTLKSDNNYVQVSLPPVLNDVRDKLIEKLMPIYSYFFKNSVKKNKISNIDVALRIDFSFDGVDSSPSTANWHVDRFLPTINAIYFPNGANWGCFEKDFGDPLITNSDIQYYVNDKKKNKKTPENIREDYYFKFQNRFKKKFTFKNNTMYVGTHHIQHRRSPIYTPGKRIGIFIDTYNFFTRDDL